MTWFCVAGLAGAFLAGLHLGWAFRFRAIAREARRAPGSPGHDQRIVRRLCAAAVAADEALSHEDEHMTGWRKELCDAVDDYFAGEELPRNARQAMERKP